MFYLIFSNGSTISKIDFRGGAIATFFTIIALTFALYLFRSIGIFTLAKKKRIKNAWIAFIPAVWIFTACKIIGSTRFFGKPFKDIALVIAIIFSVCEGLSLIYDFLSYYPILLRVLGNSGEVYWILDDPYYASSNNLVSYPYLAGFYVTDLTFTYKPWIEKLMTVIYYLNYFLEIVSIVITVSVYFAIFRLYWPEHYVLASLLSVFLPLFGILVFAIRNRKAINYNDYLKARYQAYYGNGGGINSGNQDEDPFSEFSDKKDGTNGKENEDPFSDFFDDKDKK